MKRLNLKALNCARYCVGLGVMFTEHTRDNAVEQLVMSGYITFSVIM